MWTVEHSYFTSGAVRVEIRKTKDGDKNRQEEHTDYVLFVRIFGSRKKARQFALNCNGA